MSFYKAGTSYIRITGNGRFGRRAAPENPAPGGGGGGSGASGKTLLTQSDFTYLGYYSLSLGGDFCYGQGLTHRYVDGQLRLLMLGRNSSSSAPTVMRLYEVVPPTLNSERNTALATWNDIWAGKYFSAENRWIGLHWDDATGELWTTCGNDYPQGATATSQGNRVNGIAITALGGSGVVSSVSGLYGLENVGCRRMYGGFVQVPSWFQTAYNTGPYAVGFGGYVSLMAQYVNAAMGLTLYAFQHPRDTLGLPGTAEALADVGVGTLSTSQYKVLADPGAQSDNGVDWYYGTSRTTPTTFDRGKRLAGYHANFYDSGGSYPTTPATHWAVGPDGYARWTWGDSYYQNCVWIDGPTKHGFFGALVAHDGNTWYQNSTLNWNDKASEFHIYNPDHFGEVLAGSRVACNLAPVHAWRPAEIPLKGSGGQGNSDDSAVSGVTFDSVTNRLYVRRTFNNGTWPNTRDRIYVYGVNL